jgi:hypothetical protein
MPVAAARAENWIDMGTNAAVRPELAAGFAFCVDTDSMKTDKQGWTSYTWKMCREPKEVFEDAVQCAQDFSAEQVPMREKALVANGKPKPGQPWATKLTYVSSMSGSSPSSSVTNRKNGFKRVAVSRRPSGCGVST